MPIESNLRKATNTYWSDSDAMLAVAVELLDSQRLQFMAVNTKEGTRIPSPLHIPRPWDTVEKEETFGTTASQFREMVGDLLTITVKDI